MTGEQLAFDCDPTWTTNRQPTDEPPNPWAIRQAELNDLCGQGISLYGIYRATTIHAPEYL